MKPKKGGSGGGGVDKGVQIEDIPACWRGPKRPAYLEWKELHLREFREIAEGTSFRAQSQLAAWASHGGLLDSENEDWMVSAISARLKASRPPAVMLYQARRRWQSLASQQHYGVLNSRVPVGLGECLATLRRQSRTSRTQQANAWLALQLAAEEGFYYQRVHQGGGTDRGIACPCNQLAAGLVTAGIYPHEELLNAQALVKRFMRRLKRGRIAGLRIEEIAVVKGVKRYRLTYGEAIQPEEREHLADCAEREFPELFARGIVPNEMLSTAANQLARATWPRSDRYQSTRPADGKPVLRQARHGAGSGT